MEFLLRTPSAAAIDGILTDPDVDVHVPALCDVETAAVLRRLSLGRILGNERREQALTDYVELPLTRHGHLSLLPRILELRGNFSAYDATYVALAERLGAGLLTLDRRLGRGAREHTGVGVLPE